MYFSFSVPEKISAKHGAFYSVYLTGDLSNPAEGRKWEAFTVEFGSGLFQEGFVAREGGDQGMGSGSCSKPLLLNKYFLLTM